MLADCVSIHEKSSYFLWLFFNCPHTETRKRFSSLWMGRDICWLSWKWIEGISLNPSESQYPHLGMTGAEWWNYFSSWHMFATGWEHEIHIWTWTFWLKNILPPTQQRTPVTLTLLARRGKNQTKQKFGFRLIYQSEKKKKTPSKNQVQKPRCQSPSGGNWPCMCPWADYAPPLSHSFPICEIESSNVELCFLWGSSGKLQGPQRIRLDIRDPTLSPLVIHFYFNNLP